MFDVTHELSLEVGNRSEDAARNDVALDLTRFGGHFIVTEVRGVHNGKATTNVYAGVPAADG